MSIRCLGITKYKTQYLNYSKTLNYCHSHQNQNKKEVIEVEECLVCLNEINTQLSCGHKVHTSCVVKSEKQECPLCRQNINLSNDDISKMLLYDMKYKIDDTIETRNKFLRIMLSHMSKPIDLNLLCGFLEEQNLLYLDNNVIGITKNHEIYNIENS
jgi:hypothetical protein